MKHATLLCLALGCVRREGDFEPREPAAGASASHDEAVRRIVSSQCQREEACNNVGSGKRYDDEGTCEREVSESTSSTLRAEACAVVDPRRLDDCLDEVKNQACSEPSVLTACRQSELCLSER